LSRAADYDAVVVAVAALTRLGLDNRIAEALEPSVVLPQVGQGALAVECRVDDQHARELLAAIDDRAAHIAVGTERAFLARLGGGCELPCGALAHVDGGEVHVDALLASPDGHVVLRLGHSARDPIAAGTEVAEQLLARGGADLLADYGASSDEVASQRRSPGDPTTQPGDGEDGYGGRST
jgi:hydroxymethylbilane synthase